MLRSGLYALALIVAAHSAFAQTLQRRWKVSCGADAGDDAPPRFAAESP